MNSDIYSTEIIFYVANQEESYVFYKMLLGREAELHVPGMTEFRLNTDLKFGIMPNKGIANILLPHTPHPQLGYGIPRCELYLSVENCDDWYQHAIDCGAKSISPPQDRNWGDRVAYCADPDGHILAFAQKDPGKTAL